LPISKFQTGKGKINVSKAGQNIMVISIKDLEVFQMQLHNLFLLFD
jgi:hypothetical protein